MIHRSSKLNYFFYFETITASFQHLDQWLIDTYQLFSSQQQSSTFQVWFKYLSSSFLVSFKIFSSLHHYSILLTILPNCAGPILPPAPLQQCRRLNFYEEKRTSLKISSLTGNFKDLCKKKTCCWYFACQGTSMSKLENTNSCIHQLTDGRLSFSATGASSRKIRFHNIFATAVLSSFICEKMHILLDQSLFEGTRLIWRL